MPKFGTEITLFRYFLTAILKEYRDIGNQDPRFCLNAKFREKTEMPKFGTKDALFVIWG